jgi:hypothetical protein
MIFNPATFLIARTFAQQQGVSDQEATRLGLLGGVIRPPALGIAAAAVIARNEAPVAPPAPPAIPAIRKIPVPDVTTATTGRESEHASLVLWREGFAVIINGLAGRNAAPVDNQAPPAGTQVAPGTVVTLTVRAP